MPPTKNTQERIDLIDSLLNALETPLKDLTKWEENFLESVSDQFQRTRDLSDRQLEVLDRIYTEKT